MRLITYIAPDDIEALQADLALLREYRPDAREEDVLRLWMKLSREGRYGIRRAMRCSDPRHGQEKP